MEPVYRSLAGIDVHKKMLAVIQTVGKPREGGEGYWGVVDLENRRKLRNALGWALVHSPGGVHRPVWPEMACQEVFIGRRCGQRWPAGIIRPE